MRGIAGLALYVGAALAAWTLGAAGAAQGTVWFPAGVYRCHGLKVPPHVTLLADPAWIFRCEKAGARPSRPAAQVTCQSKCD